MITIDTYIDPCCPWAWTAEASRLALHWRYGEQLAWRRRYPVINPRSGEAETSGFTPKVEAEEDTAIAARWHTPLHLQPRSRITTSLEPCRALIAARGLDTEGEERLLRALWIRGRARGEMTDRPEILAAAASDAGLDLEQLEQRMTQAEVREALDDDIRAARDLDPVARQLAHKLGGGGQRYSTPTWIIRRDDRQVVLPGFQPLESYETALANLAPDLDRRPAPADAQELLDWAAAAVTTAEAAAVLGLPADAARRQLRGAGARFEPAGSDGLWAPPNEIDPATP